MTFIQKRFSRLKGVREEKTWHEAGKMRALFKGRWLQKLREKKDNNKG